MATLIVTEDLAAPASIGRGGHALRLLQGLHGLQRLDHHVIFVEFLKQDPGAETNAVIAFFRQVIETWWRPDQAALIVEPSGQSLYGLDLPALQRRADNAAALITAAAPYRSTPYPFLEKIRPRILIEQDPAYTHLWAGEGPPANVFGHHDFYFTVGGNIGTPRCAVPTCSIQWRPTWNPILPDWWTPGRALARDRFTTVADWRSYGYLEFQGQVLGPKAEEFRRFLTLPALAGEPLGMALDIDPEDPDLALLRQNNWLIENPNVISSVADYRAFIEGSFGEFSCAKGGYVATRSGWFSDRSACYLAAGRPAVLQATGFEDLLPTGKGLFAVKTPEEAAHAIRAIRADYPAHSIAARKLACEYLSADVVLPHMLSQAGIGD